MKELKTTITAEEKEDILAMFSQLLKERPNIIKDNNSSSVKNTIEQACFISKGLDGEADGIFFPNSIFEINNQKKVFVCLCIYDEKPSICQTYSKIKSLEGKYYYTSLESLIYSNEELERKKELNYYINDYQDKIELLNSIYRIYKKDGKDFQDFKKNFSSTINHFSISFESNTKIALCASKIENGFYKHYEDTFYLSSTGYTNENVTPSIFMELINDEIKKYNDYLIGYKNQLNNLHSEALKIEKIFNDLLSKKDNFVNKVFFKKYIEKNIYKLNR